MHLLHIIYPNLIEIILTVFFVTEIKSSLLNVQFSSTGIHVLTLLDKRSCLSSNYLNVNCKVYIRSSGNYSNLMEAGSERLATRLSEKRMKQSHS